MEAAVFARPKTIDHLAGPLPFISFLDLIWPLGNMGLYASIFLLLGSRLANWLSGLSCFGNGIEGVGGTFVRWLLRMCDHVKLLRCRWLGKVAQ